MNVSFAGCGFLGLYHVGVASCFKTYAPQLYLHKVSGASAGSIAAVALLADVPLGEMTSNILRIASEARARALGPFSPSFKINQILYEGLNRILPDDIHLKVQGRLHVSLTKVYDGSNVLVNQFANKEEVIQVVLASTFIPVFSGWLPPRYRGVRVIDGGYSDNLPVINGQTITVSPFSGNSDICPQDDTAWKVFQVSVANTSIEVSKENLYRLGNVLLPPDPEVLARVCKQGFEDALRYLQKRYLISCTRCLTVNSNYKIEEENEEDDIQDSCKNHDTNCLECKLKREVAKESSVPESVWVVFENAISEAEAGFTSWIRMIPASRVIRLLTLPAALPFNICSRLISRLVSLLPSFADDLKLTAALEKLIEQLCAYMTSSGYMVKHQHHLARYTCEFNITQYGEEEEDVQVFKENRESVKDLFSMELTAELESNMEVDLPNNQAEAIRFQNDNLIAAVASGSRIHSRINSRATSVASSRAVSRMGSRKSSLASLAGLDEDSPVLEHIREVTQYQDAVIAFYYTDAANQVKMTEIFDVTTSDPGLLADDLHSCSSQSVLPSHSLVSDALSNIQEDGKYFPTAGRSYSDYGGSRHGSGRSRHGSGVSEAGFSSHRVVNTTPLIGHGNTTFKIGGTEFPDEFPDERPDECPELRRLSRSTSNPEKSHERRGRKSNVALGNSSPDQRCDSPGFSDPESDWTVPARQSALQ